MANVNQKADKPSPAQPQWNRVVSEVSTATEVTPPVTKAPMYWLAELRPSVIIISEDRPRQIHFDVNFAGAKFAGKWEDEWPLMTKEEFLKALDDVSKLEIGGQWPDGNHFTKDSRGASARSVAPQPKE
jgi:hypothetical protein